MNISFNLAMAKPTKDPQEALKKVTAQLECGICLDEYKDPKLLSCFHVFCKQCLEPLVLHRREQSLLDCPNCRHTTVLPPRGVKGLRSDFRMHHLFEIQDALTKAKEPEKTQCEKCKSARDRQQPVFAETVESLYVTDAQKYTNFGTNSN